MAIQLSPENLARLRTEGRKNVPATIRMGEEIFQEVQIHLKGSGGSFREVDDRPSLTLDFARSTREPPSRNWVKIHLNNSVEDPTLLREQLGSELFAAAGIPVPRVAHARVEWNGRSLGLYVMKEGFTADFLSRHFERADGNLYDTDWGHDVDEAMKRHQGTAPEAGQKDLQELAAAASEPNLVRRGERLRRVLDLERFARFLAMEVLIGHWDGYGMGRNNFRIYHDPDADRIVFLPSGMDQILVKTDLPWRPEFSGLVARAFMGTPEGRELYAATFRQLFAELFQAERLTNRVHQLVEDLRPFLKSGELKSLRREAAELCHQITGRQIDLQHQLSEPAPALPQFENGVAVLNGWRKSSRRGSAMLMDVSSRDGRPSLAIIARSDTFEFWRTSVRLDPGRYRFQGNARVEGAAPLRFGKNQGASLRVAGTNERSKNLLNTTAWESLAAEFAVTAPDTEISLVCELRASTGRAYFEKRSLALVRLE